jgi:hypothetical protein
VNATDPSTAEERQVHGEMVLTRLAGATIEVEDQATAEAPAEAMLRIGDRAAGVRFVGDLVTIQRLMAEADRQVTRLYWERRVL